MFLNIQLFIIYFNILVYCASSIQCLFNLYLMRKNARLKIKRAHDLNENVNNSMYGNIYTSIVKYLRVDLA